MTRITNINQMVDAELEGRSRTYMIRKNPSQATVSGFWFDLSLSPGSPPPKYWFDSTPTIGIQVKQSTDGGLFHGANVSPAHKYLRKLSLMTSTATALPASFKVLDYLLYYPSIDDSIIGEQTTVSVFNVLSTFTVPGVNDYHDNTLTLQTNNLDNLTKCQVSSTGVLPTGLSPLTDYWSFRVSDTECRLSSSRENAVLCIPIEITDSGTGIHSLRTILPRYTSGNNVQILPISVASRVGGTTFTVTYTNSLGVSGRVSKVMMQNANSTVGVVVTSDPARATGSANCSSLFITLQEGDTGVQSIESINMITGDVGLVSFLLVVPLAETELKEVTAPYEKDFFMANCTLPQIKDDAFIGLLVVPVGSMAGTGLIGYMNVIWN